MSRKSILVDLTKKGIAKLEDQSIWRIPEGHLPRVAEWTPGLELLVERSDNAMWQYKLKHPDTGAWVSATPASGAAQFGGAA